MTRLTALIARRAVLLGALVASFAGAGAAAAQDPAAADSTRARVRVMPGFGLRAGTPQKASAALGLVVGREWRADGRDRSRNVALFVEPGLSAGRASLAVVSEFGNLGSGIGLGASVLRTWKDPLTLETNRTFVGADLFVFPVFFIGPRVGVYRQVSTPTRAGWFIVVDFGIGL